MGTYSLPGGDSIFTAALINTQSVPEPSSLVLGLIGTIVAGSYGVSRYRRGT